MMATAAAIAMAGRLVDELDGNNMLKRIISMTATKTTINKKYKWMGSTSSLQCCSGLRRIGGGLLLTGTNNGGSVALEDEDVEDDNVEGNGKECGD